MSPVVDPPRVRVFPRRDCMELLAASRTNPFPVDPERVAIGVSLAIPVTANCALVVEFPPIAKSTVEFPADSNPFACCQ